MTLTPTPAKCIAVVFVGIWLEAATHLAIVQHHGVKKAKEFDRRPYNSEPSVMSPPLSFGRAHRAARNSARAYFESYRKELVAELRLLGIELPLLPLGVRPLVDDGDKAEAVRKACEEEICEKERFADSNYARAYVDGIF